VDSSRVSWVHRPGSEGRLKPADKSIQKASNAPEKRNLNQRKTEKTNNQKLTDTQ